ncbi:MAG TPA: PadR family transcriptional regulator [Vicinamibacterales bacterium]|nr:PadR family transcriptional regulator [Vicinamibacterales bacterium]
MGTSKARTPDSLQGSLELLILKTVESGPNHGFGIALHIQTASEGLLRIEEGSLYPALHRMQKQGLLKAEWKVTDNLRRARYYRITAAGQRRLAEAQESWSSLSKGVNRVLRFA